VSHLKTAQSNGYKECEIYFHNQGHEKSEQPFLSSTGLIIVKRQFQQ